MEPFISVEQASGTYPIFVGTGLLDEVGSLVRARGRVFVISTPALHHFSQRVVRSFADEATLIEVAEGESRKTLDTANAIVTALLDGGARRDSMAVVVGGGMLGDTAGFAASIVLRGIDLVHVPTTLLAQVDSSIGGKVAVNHERGKNLVGSFHPPRAVVADLSTLSTLPERERNSGLFEALKGGVIGDPELFDLFADGVPSDLGDVVRRAIRVKADIVSADEKEADLRRLLNYGHTIGHGIEAAMNYDGITHGEALGWGMVAANAIAVRRGILDAADARRIEDAIRAVGIPPLPHLDRRAILGAAEHDKKNTSRDRIMVLPRAIGECEVVPVSAAEVEFGVSAIL